MKPQNKAAEGLPVDYVKLECLVNLIAGYLANPDFSKMSATDLVLNASQVYAKIEKECRVKK